MEDSFSTVKSVIKGDVAWRSILKTVLTAKITIVGNLIMFLRLLLMQKLHLMTYEENLRLIRYRITSSHDSTSQR